MVSREQNYLSRTVIIGLDRNCRFLCQKINYTFFPMYGPWLKTLLYLIWTSSIPPPLLPMRGAACSMREVVGSSVVSSRRMVPFIVTLEEGGLQCHELQLECWGCIRQCSSVLLCVGTGDCVAASLTVSSMVQGGNDKSYGLWVRLLLGG